MIVTAHAPTVIKCLHCGYPLSAKEGDSPFVCRYCVPQFKDKCPLCKIEGH